MTALRVLIVADVSPLVVVGGSERVIWEHARRLAARGHRVRVVARQPEAGGAIRVDREGVGIRHFTAARRPAWDFIRASIVGARRAVAKEVRAHGADVLHFHQPLSAFGVLTSPALRRLPSLYTFHSPAALEYRGRRGTSDWHRRGIAGGVGAAFLRALERWTLARVTRIHVLSDYSAGLLRSLYGIAGDRVVKIAGGVDTARFRPPDEPRDVVRAELGWPTGRPILFTLRNLEPRMGLDELLRAADRLRRRVPRVLLMIGGAGALGGELGRLVEQLGLAGHVRLLGFVAESQLVRCYQAADVFVLPTQALEGFGLVTVEALACGTPVLGTPVGATPEILGPLSKALLFSGASAPAMVEDLARFLEALSQDPTGGDDLRRACRRHAERHYAWDAAVDRLDATLAALAFSDARDDRCVACGDALHASVVLGARAFHRCVGCRTARVSVLPGRARIRFHYEVEYPRRFDHSRVAPARLRLLGSIATTLAALRAPGGPLRAPGCPGRALGRLVDVGCGGGHLVAEAARMGWRAVGSDLSHDACVVTRAGTGRPAVQSDSAALPVRDGAFDAVALLNVVDHTTDPLAVVREAHRVLGPGGVLAIRTTNARFHFPVARFLGSAGWLGRLVPLHPVFHVWSFTPRGLRRLVERAGFVVVAVRSSPPVAEGSEEGEAAARTLAVFRVLLAAGAGVAATLSRGRWLMAPSIELYARRPAGEARYEP